MLEESRLEKDFLLSWIAIKQQYKSHFAKSAPHPQYRSADVSTPLEWLLIDFRSNKLPAEGEQSTETESH